MGEMKMNPEPSGWARAKGLSGPNSVAPRSDQGRLQGICASGTWWDFEVFTPHQHFQLSVPSEKKWWSGAKC